MPFDKPTRNLLAKIVAACRDKLAADITDQLQSTYGLYPDGTTLDVARTEDERRAAEDLRALLTHFEAAEAGGEQECKAAAYQRMVREIGFTLLNRLAALRLAEERGLVIECVRRGMASDGFQLFDRLVDGALGNRYQTYRAFLEKLFDELALDLGVLFDRSTPQSHVFPGEAAMTGVLALLNDSELTARNLWQQDETIGWIYQYYNGPAERRAMRDASQAPRNSRELAVRNQFFTPRYVVEFLTDNTLGRTWYEMRRGNTRLVDECRYLVRRPNEVFLAPGKKTPTPNPQQPTTDIESPAYIPFRPKKDPRDLKILDPACGSGHFLLYAFDLLTTIYEEAWTDSESPPFTDTGTTLAADYPNEDTLRRAIPALILRHNLYGIDIDSRAVQIAALALWLRAQRAYQELGLPPAARPRITKTNIVTAEPMPGDEELLDEFIAGLEPPLIGDLVRVVFERMKLAGEAGALLKIEEELKDAISTARRQWAAQPQAEQLTLFPKDRRPKPEQLPLFDVSGITDEAFWETAEARALDALQDYATRVENGKATRRRLFAEDAAQGFAFVDLCRQRFDMVLMNPPYGSPSNVSRRYLQLTYSKSYQDCYGAFVLRAIELVGSQGIVGVLTSRTFLNLSKFQTVRELALSLMHSLVDLGPGVLDGATVQTAAYVLETEKNKVNIDDHIIFINLDNPSPENKAIELQEIAASLPSSKRVFLRPRSFLKKLPNQTINYSLPSSVYRAFERFHPLSSYLKPAVGLQTGDDFRFIRSWVEIDMPWRTKGWPLVPTGGKPSRFFRDMGDVVNWQNDACEMKAYYRELAKVMKSPPGNGPLRDFPFYFVPGLAYIYTSSTYFSCQPLPYGAIVTTAGQGLFFLSETRREEHFFYWLGTMNSWITLCMLRVINPGRFFQAGYVSKVPTVAEFECSQSEAIASKAQMAASIKLWYCQFDETSRFFHSPLVLAFNGTGIADRSIFDLLANYDAQYKKCQETVDEVAAQEFELELKDIERLDSTFGYREPTSIWFDDSSNPPQDRIWSDLLSYCVGLVLGRWDIRVRNTHAPEPLEADFFLSEIGGFPPGMLIRPDGLPATSGNIVSEAWLRARPNVITLPELSDQGTVISEDGTEQPATIPDEQYPIRIAWDGILVDDPGTGEHPEPYTSDIVRRGREVLAVLWPENHVAIEAEACEILGVRALREYFRKPAGFFADHLKRYSKSRRKAPIYWPLSTASGSYTLWIYYHRLDDQILYTAVNRYVGPKIERVDSHVARLKADLAGASGAAASKLRDRLDDVRAFLAELREFHDELLRIAGLPYKPNLNDGVIINAAPLHKLFRLRKWAKDTEKVWQKLEAGDYDWAHMAYTFWPDRVREVCKRDRSIAIAHGLEELCEVPEKVTKKKRRKKKAEMKS